MIRHTTARRTACAWHGGGGSPLYQLCSTGAIVSDGPSVHQSAWREIVNELSRTLRTATKRDRLALKRLHEYVTTYGPRGPVDGWSK